MDQNRVRPQRWGNPNYRFLLFNNNDYSIIWGEFDGIPAMGVRWNGDDEEIGYPRQGPHPLWYVEPDIIALGILNHLLTLETTNTTLVNTGNITFALGELNNKMSR